MVIHADTSFLFSLYGNDAKTPEAMSWVASNNRRITISSLNEFELGNALRFAEFRRAIAAGEAAQFWSKFESDKEGGWLSLRSCDFSQVIAKAAALSTARTLTGGHRAFDILHVASALHFGAAVFLTFDANQKRLAEAEGLIVPI